MKKLLIFTGLVLVALNCPAPVYQNKFVANANPEAIGWTNTATAGITATVKATLGSTNAVSIATNLSQRFVNPADGTGIIASRLGSGYAWAAIPSGDLLLGVAPSVVIIYTNAEFRGSYAVMTVGQWVGNGAGLTNLASATNFPAGPTYVYHGKVTFNSNVVINSLSFPTNLWSGPTNTITLNTNYQDFVASTDCAITGVKGQIAGQNTWTTLNISNSSGSAITVFTTASGVRLQGASTSAALSVPAGKEALFSFLSRDFKSTNMVNTVEQ